MAIHLYHYNINAEQRSFLGDLRNLFDLVGFNGNIVSHTPAGVAGFVATVGKPYFIDPQTHAFQHSTDKIKRDVSDRESGEPPRLEFKPSVEALATRHLGEPFSEVIEQDEPLRPQRFFDNSGNPDPTVIRSLCQRSLGFQTDILYDSLGSDDQEFISRNELRPEFIVAPYFCLDSRSIDSWLRVNEACYGITRELADSHEVYYSLVLPQEVLQFERSRIVQALRKLRPEGILLWVDNQYEEDLSEDEIDHYVSLLRDLHGVTGKVINIHGGYMSILLCHADAGQILDGVGHSVNYGECRPIVPVGGGIPLAPFYLPPIHSRLKFADALGVIRDMDWFDTETKYRQKVCSCIQCNEMIQQTGSAEGAFALYGETYQREYIRRDGVLVRRDFPTADTKRIAARHYLFNKAKEFDNVSERNLEVLLNDLQVTFREISREHGYELIGHLKRWQSAVSRLLSG
jgi:hypothetical protein